MRPMFALVFLLGIALPVRAQLHYSFQPNPATTADHVRLRIDVEGCFSETHHAHVDTIAKTIVARYEGDKTPCDPANPANVATPRFVDVGQLPKGVYGARVEGCVAFSFPPNTCTMHHHEALLVFAPPRSASPSPPVPRSAGPR